jgi:pyruvate dehydrogenase E2 component (dihydrolipoamide acetyltransferase)
MAQIVVMPKLSDTMEEGAVASWLKKEGEAIEEGQDLVEIETDKATMAYSSPADGIVLKILVQPKKTVALGTALAVIGEKGESFDLAALTGGAGDKAQKKGEPESKKAEPKKEEAAPAKSAAPAKNEKPAAAATPAPESKKTPSQQDASGRVKASPLARKMAEDKGVNLGSVAGSGPNGRVIARDLENAASGGGGRSAPAQRGDHVVELSMMRKTIAKRLLAGKNEAPHFYLTVSVNMAEMNDWRARLNQNAEKTGVKVSVNDLIIMSVAKALVLHPQVNASWQGETITEYGDVHVAMAVALPTGLVTPVIRHADQLGVRDIAKTSKEMAQRAKAGKLTTEEYTGGTFTQTSVCLVSKNSRPSSIHRRPRF